MTALDLYKARGGLVPKKITETVHGKNKTFQRTRTVMVRPDEETSEMKNHTQVRAAMDFVEEFHKKLPTYYVGGVVRDQLRGKTPRDVDVISVGTPEAIKRHLNSMGVKHFVASGKYEIVTAQPADGVDVEIIGIPKDKLMADLERRDFTINAMGQSPTGDLLDPFGGQKDLKANILRSPNDDSDTSFVDDPIRMIRAARFVGAQGFQPSKNLTESIQRNKHLLGDPSKAPRERFQRELEKAMKSPNLTGFLQFMADNGILEHVHPALAAMVDHPQNTPHHKYDVWEHTMETIRHMDSTDPFENLAALLHDVGKPASSQDNNSTFHGHEDVGSDLTREIMQGLKYDSAATERMAGIVKNHMWIHNVNEDEAKPGALRRFKMKVGDDLKLVAKLSRADSRASAHGDDVSKEDRMEKRVRELPDLGPTSQDKAGLSPLNGTEIIDLLGIKKPGREIQEVKEHLHGLVVDEVIDPADKDAAKKEATAEYYRMLHKGDSGSILLKTWGYKPDWHGKGPVKDKDPDEQAHNRENHKKAGKPKKNPYVSYMDRIHKAGYFAPVVKEVSADGQRIWFQHGDENYVADIGVSGEEMDIQKAAMTYRGPSRNQQGNEGIKYATAEPQSRKNRRWQDGTEINDDED